MTFEPIGCNEVQERVKRLKNKTAAGLDRVSKTDVAKQGVAGLLTKVFNLVLLSGVYPEEWKRNRTVLIPKGKDNLDDISNWRPITIGSVISRLFSGVLDARLRRYVKLDERQKGFVPENGCLNNVATLESAIRAAKEGGGGVFGVLDTAKAFDTVPHEIIGERLIEAGAPRYIAELIARSYDGCNTEIKAGDDSTVKINIQRGVKQGDPLSPLVFNCTIDPLVTELNKSEHGMCVGGGKVGCLAFADDLALTSSTKQGAQSLLNMTVDFLGAMKMKLAPHKCHAFEIVPARKTYICQDPKLQVGEARIPYLSAEQSTKYLGIRVGPWSGVTTANSDVHLIEAVKRLINVPLKVGQKLIMLTRYIVPHFIYSLVSGKLSQTRLAEIDSEIRQLIKSALHLQPCVTDNLIYAPRKDGGLGILNLEKVVAHARLKHWAAMNESSDSVLRDVANEPGTLERARALACKLGVPWQPTTEAIESAKRKYKAEYAQSWSRLTSQGQGVKEAIDNPLSNSWLARTWLLKPSRFISALQLRSNTFGVLTAIERGRMQSDVRCRGCHEQVESLGHVLGQCQITKKNWMRRHDEIVELVAKIASKRSGIDLLKETRVQYEGRQYRPDLVLIDAKRRKALVVDVTIKYENGNWVEEGQREKVSKYQAICDHIKEVHDCDSCRVVPLVIGARGIVPRETRVLLSEVGLSQRDITTVSLVALRSSIELAHRFIDRVGRRKRR